MKYYFITYQAENWIGGKIDVWNDLTDKTPMQFLLDKKDQGKYGSKGHNFFSPYYNFAILNALEITESEYNEFK